MQSRKLEFYVASVVWLHVIGCRAQGMLGAAEVRITNVEQCPDAERYRYSVQLSRRMVSRAVEAYSGNASFDIPIDSAVGLYANLAKLVDGGYKPNAYEISDDYACEFLMRHFKEGFGALLRNLGLDAACPVPPGEYTVRDFIVDYDAMPENLLYGEFRVDAFATVGGAGAGGERIFCIRVYIISQPRNGSSLG